MTAFSLATGSGGYTAVMRTLIMLLAVLAGGCNSQIYTRDGVTDGDTFYVAEYAYFDPDPALAAWVTYSLDLAACQLTIGGENPARNSSYACELGARRSLVDDWRDKRALDRDVADRYLDSLLRIADAGYLPEYVAVEYRRRSWDLPEDLDLAGFRNWRRAELRGHRAERRIVGSWNYRDAVAEL